MITIKDYISLIYNDFKQYLEQDNDLCVLKTLNYQAGQKPDYSDIHIQQLYLLRYVFRLCSTEHNRNYAVNRIMFCSAV